MNQYGNSPNGQHDPYRAERYAGEMLNEPSMSAPQPIPGDVSGKPRRSRRMAAYASEPAVPPEMSGVSPAQSYGMPQPPSAPGQWQQPYASQPMAQQQGWQQPYASQPAAEPVSWQQPQAPVQQGWPQQPAAQPPAPQTDWKPAPFTPQPAAQATAPQADWQPAWTGSNGYTPPVQQIPEEPSRKGGGGGSWWKLTLLALLAVAVIAGIVAGGVEIGEQTTLHSEVSAYNDRFCEGVFVDGIHLGGMTQAEAIAAVNAHAQERLAAWSINLTYGGQLIRSITAHDLGMTVNVHDALAEAWEQGHATSDVDERKAAMDALLVEPYYGYTAMPSGDTSVVDRILRDLAAPVYREPVDATVTFNPEAYSYPFEYTPEVNGWYLDVGPIKTQIYGMVDNMQAGDIELVPTVLTASVTEADLRWARTLRGSATTEISSMSTANRTDNIERASELINGTVISPGKNFSFNTVVGKRSAANGFKKAIEYAYGEEREGYGGGVCQSSTTVYLAAVRADMNITKREAHSDKVNYTAYGLDATVNLDGRVIDLVFKNDTGSDVYVMSYLVWSSGHWVCHVDIYGEALPEGVTYDLVAQTVEVLPAPVEPEYYEDKTGEHVLYIDDPPVQRRGASDGCIVETYKVKYVNGKEAERTFVARDTYKAKAQQLWVGIKDRPLTWP
ncbi:MAG: VanW family protein [Clostridia bacterium]|nr:VanW family protein [Clostridia bacterium]